MGEEPEEYEAGDDCNTCWGVGKTFGDKPTPKFVTVTFNGVQLSDDPGCAHLPPAPDGVSVTCEQIGACAWYGEELINGGPNKYTVNFQYTPVSTGLEGRINGGTRFFGDLPGVICEGSFTNFLVPPNCYFGGTASVT